ncbi:hypothetical protein U9M48_002710 [Paspalum notatum var. saurae]|uniref:Uncharacterized protein n=1 Tax=Paspalum notatum var. saurae TaxID=547442 RepID=A0AAQ3PRH3_PASNO
MRKAGTKELSYTSMTTYPDDGVEYTGSRIGNVAGSGDLGQVAHEGTRIKNVVSVRKTALGSAAQESQAG